MKRQQRMQGRPKLKFGPSDPNPDRDRTENRRGKLAASGWVSEQWAGDGGMMLADLAATWSTCGGDVSAPARKADDSIQNDVDKQVAQ